MIQTVRANVFHKICQLNRVTDMTVYGHIPLSLSLSLSLSLISVKMDSGHLRWSICENLPNVPARVILTEVGQISFRNLLISAVPCFAYFFKF